MKRKFAVALALCCLVSATAFAVDPATQQIQARFDGFAAAWARHDPSAMAAFWAPDGELVNPMGRVARGRAEIVKLFTDEQTTAMKGSTYTPGTVSVRMLAPDLALIDADGVVTGVLGPGGAVAPPMKVHVTAVMQKKDGQWWDVSARAFSFMQPPPPPNVN